MPQCHFTLQNGNDVWVKGEGEGMAQRVGRLGSRPELDSGTVSCHFSLSLGRAENSMTSVPSAPIL